MKQVLLQLPAKDRYWVGVLKREPRRGMPLVVSLDGNLEYVTSPVVRVLRLTDDDVYFVETAHNTYRMTAARKQTQVSA